VFFLSNKDWTRVSVLFRLFLVSIAIAKGGWGVVLVGYEYNRGEKGVVRSINGDGVVYVLLVLVVLCSCVCVCVCVLFGLAIEFLKVLVLDLCSVGCSIKTSLGCWLNHGRM
jgi:hypothetical protein